MGTLGPSLSHVSTVSVLSGTSHSESIVDVDANPAYMAFALQKMFLPVYGVIDLETTPELVTTFEVTFEFTTDAIGVAVDQLGTIYAVESVQKSASEIGQIAKFVEGGSVPDQVETIEGGSPIGIAFSAEQNILLVSLLKSGRDLSASIVVFDPMLTTIPTPGLIVNRVVGTSAPVVIETSPSSAFALTMVWTGGTSTTAVIIDLTASSLTSAQVDSPIFVGDVNSIPTADALSVSSDGSGFFFATSSSGPVTPILFACDGTYLTSSELPSSVAATVANGNGADKESRQTSPLFASTTSTAISISTIVVIVVVVAIFATLVFRKIKRSRSHAGFDAVSTKSAIPFEFDLDPESFSSLEDIDE